MKQKVDLVIKNAKIWTEIDQKYALRDSQVAINQGTIVEIGALQNLDERFEVSKFWDAQGKVLLPGFINTHCHLFQTFIRGLGKDLPFIEWMNNSVRIMMPEMDYESVYLAAMMGCMEAIRTGTTTLVDFMYANVKPNLSDAVMQAFDDCGIRGILARGLTDVERLPGSPVRPASWSKVEDSLIDHDRLRLKYKDNPRMGFMLAPSVIWGMTRDGLKTVVDYAKSQDMVVTMHILETADDDQFSLKNYGKRTIRALEEIGILETKFLAVHCIRMEQEDTDLFIKYGTSISHNPVANMILGSGVAPISKLTGLGIPISLGTDGAASNDSQSLIEVMKTAALLQKVHYRDTASLSAREVFSMATNQGAKAIHMDDQIGTLEAGKKADILVVDFKKPNTTPCYHPIASLVYSGSEGNINSVFIEGALIYEDGQFTQINEVTLLKKAQQKAEELYRQALSK